jgi:hypothetical protein
VARFVALLLIGPWLAVLAWLYWLYVRKSHAAPDLARRDIFVVVAAFAAAIAGAMIAWEAAIGHGGAIWKYLAGPVGAYAGFNLVLAYGLLRHLQWRRRRS